METTNNSEENTFLNAVLTELFDCLMCGRVINPFIIGIVQTDRIILDKLDQDSMDLFSIIKNAVYPNSPEIRAMVASQLATILMKKYGDPRLTDTQAATDKVVKDGLGSGDAP